jgi:hypothetical protein
MGEYEERYPDAYGRDETAGQPPAEAELHLPPRQHRQSTLFRTRFGLGAAAETAPAWRHSPTSYTPPPEPEKQRLVEPIAPPRRAEGSCRGFGPRGYIRSDQRIYEDICDRLTENPFIDASDITVTVRDRTVTLAGSVDSVISLHQAREIAREVVGVTTVRNDLIIAGDGRREPTPGERVDRAMPAPRPDR